MIRMLNELPPRGRRSHQYVRAAPVLSGTAFIGAPLPDLQMRGYYGVVQEYEFHCPRCDYRWWATALRVAACPSGRQIYDRERDAWVVCRNPVELPVLELDEIEAWYTDGAGDA